MNANLSFKNQRFHLIKGERQTLSHGCEIICDQQIWTSTLSEWKLASNGRFFSSFSSADPNLSGPFRLLSPSLTVRYASALSSAAFCQRKQHRRVSANSRLQLWHIVCPPSVCWIKSLSSQEFGDQVQLYNQGKNWQILQCERVNYHLSCSL